MIKFTFNSINRDNSKEIAKSIKQLYHSQMPVIVCVGSDLSVGDSFGPMIGTALIKRLHGYAYVYGTLDSPITAKEIVTISEHILKLHPNSKIIVIDAALGEEENVGFVKVCSEGIKPGQGVNKDLPKIGNVSIIGVVADKNSAYKVKNVGVRLSLVHKLSCDVIEGLVMAFTGV